MVFVVINAGLGGSEGIAIFALSTFVVNVVLHTLSRDTDLANFIIEKTNASRAILVNTFVHRLATIFMQSVSLRLVTNYTFLRPTLQQAKVDSLRLTNRRILLVIQHI